MVMNMREEGVVNNSIRSALDSALLAANKLNSVTERQQNEANADSTRREATRLVREMRTSLYQALHLASDTILRSSLEEICSTIDTLAVLNADAKTVNPVHVRQVLAFYMIRIRGLRNALKGQ